MKIKGIGGKIKSHISKENLTQSEFAKLINTSRTTLHEMINEDYVAKVEQLVKIIEQIGEPALDLLTKETFKNTGVEYVKETSIEYSTLSKSDELLLEVLQELKEQTAILKRIEKSN